MDRRTLQTAVVAAAGILAVALSAATLPSVVETGEGGVGDAGGQGGGGMPTPEESDAPEIPLPDIPFVDEILLVVVALALLVTIVYLLVYWREFLLLGLGVAIVIAVTILVGQLLLSLTGTSSGVLPGYGGGLFGSDSARGGGMPALPSLLLALLVVVAIVGVAVALLGTGDSEGSDGEANGEAASAESAAVGRAAGEAADRLQEETGAPLENEIYRAWREMTALLDVSNPDATTPGEFENAAIAAGMASGDVRQLRRLFEDVRYGDREPTATDEQRAIDVFRRIEDTYAGEEP